MPLWSSYKVPGTNWVKRKGFNLLWNQRNINLLFKHLLCKITSWIIKKGFYLSSHEVYMPRLISLYWLFRQTKWRMPHKPFYPTYAYGEIRTHLLHDFFACPHGVISITARFWTEGGGARILACQTFQND